jgi:HD-GYP domain-containing protein (c-di-GMP phosphodiesterase class II)
MLTRRVSSWLSYLRLWSQHTGRPPLLLAYTASLVVIASGVTALGAAGRVHIAPLAGALGTVPRVLDATLLLALVWLAGLFSIHLSFHTRVSVTAAPQFAAVLLLGNPLGPCVAATGVVGYLGVLWYWRRRNGFDLALNASEALITATAGALVVPVALASPVPASVGLPLAAAAAAATMYLGNVTIIVVAVALRSRLDGWTALRDLYVSMLRATVWQHTGLYLLGLLAALNAPQYPWVPLLIAFPTTVVYFSYRANARLRTQTRAAVEAMADLVDMRDPYTFGHCQRVAELAEAVARRLRLSREQVDVIRLAARVHDLGKIGVPDQVLHKAGPLDPDEFAQMQRHPEIGAALLAKFPDYEQGRELVLSHHERCDGEGYPRRLTAHEVPLGARIIAAVDAYDAMTTDRPYRRALSPAFAAGELRRHRGRQWDAVVVDALLAVLQDRGLITQPPPVEASPSHSSVRAAAAT